MDWAALFGAFMLGAAVGAAWQVYVNRVNLLAKARPEHRTAEKIGSGFYYIVSESEYVRMRQP